MIHFEGKFMSTIAKEEEKNVRKFENLKYKSLKRLQLMNIHSCLLDNIRAEKGHLTILYILILWLSYFVSK